ncbi:DUF799 domain-containing protein [Cupriavidus basilensis]|uniref:DUF799 domain-containing protein n=1 Tax=Cupriavidus basilensis TaxID=68895 RepID=UPI0020A6C3D9|nr:DUF799 domain-containing protein [Cupriavidus basilensis]MCP3019617.1 DUF799 domain-containing protein [Cupriavidus basilensis]MDR3384756.1 DUF799 domain-containing protein [Cupriavidus basilensis]
MFKRLIAVSAVTLLAAGCAAPKRVNYAAFKESRPRSIVVLPPLNESPEVQATYSMLSQVTYPLAESGYYVLPVTLMDETFKQNGLTTAGDIHEVPPAKLQEIFGADAALYITVSKYGTSYMVISSATVVTARAKLVDLKTGKTLWTGSASASNDEGGNASGGGLIGALVAAAVKQVINSVTEAGHTVAGVTSQRLLSAGRPGSILYGPRSPKYGTD